VINAAGGCLEICGERITNTVLGSADSAVEAMCIAVQGVPERQLARQLTAAALNCVMSGGGATCSGLGDISTLFAECNSVCECSVCPGTPEGCSSIGSCPPDSLTVGQCIDALDCFNNGGHPSLSDGSCTFDSNNCENQALCNQDIGLCFKPPGPAGSSNECNDANQNLCTVIEASTPKSPGNETACKLCVGGTNAGKPCAQNAECSGGNCAPAGTQQPLGQEMCPT